ncbi:Anaphase-promoting complex subunit 5 [Chlorella vulgaris]
MLRPPHCKPIVAINCCNAQALHVPPLAASQPAPQRPVAMETVKAVDVALCVLLRAYLCPDESDPAATSDLHPLFGQALLHEIRRREETHSPSLIQLLQHGHVCPGAEEGSTAAAYFVTIKSAVGQHLSGLELPDDLVGLFTSLRDSVINQCTSAPAESEGEGADASSAMGLYLRMCYARYTAMPFEAVCSLLSDVQAYFDAAVAVLQGQPAPHVEPTLKPGPQLELFLNDRLVDMAHSIGRLPQADIERPLVKLEAAAPRLPRTHLARHFSSLHHRDSAAALDHLHRFFDRTLHTSQPAGGAPGAGAGAGASHAASAGAGQAEEAAARERGRLQAAALTLGSMHAQLGHVEEALQALNETVRIAQQASDDTCLAHALALLCLVMGATTPGTITSVSQLPGASPAAAHHSQLGQLLRRCLRRSEELQLPHLVAYSRLALARFQLLHPHQPPPAAGTDDGSGAAAAGAAGSGGSGSSPPCSSSVAVAAALRDTAHLHMATRLAASTPAVPPLASGAASARVLRGVGDLFTSTASLFAPSMAGMQSSAATEVEHLAAGAHLLQAAAWELRGSRQLSQAHSLACLAGSGGVARAEEQCTAFAQLATSVVAAHGYQAAQQVLAAADERFPLGQSRVLAAARLAIAHDRALHRLDLHAAMDLAAQMAALASPTDSTDMGLRLEAEERVARTLLAAGRVDEAVQAAQSLFAAAVATGQALHTTRLLLLLARAHQQAGSPLTALPYALTAIDHARQLHADMLAAEAAVLMARLWCDMGPQHAQHAQQELEAALPIILAHGSLELQAAAQTALAEAVMAQHTGADGLRRDAEVLGLLEDAQRLSLQLEDRGAAAHSAYLQALVHDGLGQGGLRDAGAASFATLIQPVLA